MLHTTRSGRRTKAPLPADRVRTYAPKDQVATEPDVDDNQASKRTGQRQTRSCPGPKSVMDAQTQDLPRPRPKARPLPRSEHSGPMTSSAEEDIFFSNFARKSSLSRKKSIVNEAPEIVNEAPEVQSADASALPQVEFSPDGSTTGADGDGPSAGPGEDGTVFDNSNDANGDPAMNDREKTAVPSDDECRGAAATNERGKDTVTSDGECGSAAATNERERDAVASDDECDGAAAANEMERDAVPSDGECGGTALTNEPEKTAVASTTVRPRRSGAHKSYLPENNSEPEESSGSESDWAALEEKRKKAERAADPASPFRLSAKEKQKGPAVADDHDADTEDFDEEDASEDEDQTTHKAGRLSKEAVAKAQEFGRRVTAEANAIGKKFGKHRRMILIEAGLATRATRKESAWNQHQAWFRTLLPPSKEVNLASWKVKQKAHYHDHPYKDPNHAPLWKKIRQHWDGAVASPEDLSSRESSSLMTAVRESFAKSASYWYRSHGIHIAGIAIYPGDDESGRQASGFFAGSNMVKALIDARQVDLKRLIDELTTILKYKDLEAAQAEGNGLSLLPPPVAAPNGPLLRNGKSARDRNRMVAPLIISEAFTAAGHPSKTSNSRWLKMLDILYSTQLCIHDWPAGVPPPGPDFDLKSLSASQLRALVGPYLRVHLGAMYEAELGGDEDEDDTEKATTTKRKGKSKKSNENRKTRGAIVEEPEVILSIQKWSPLQLSEFATFARNVYSIPLVINTDGVILRRLRDSEKFIKDHSSQVTRKQLAMVICEDSDTGAEHSNTAASRTKGASRSHPGPSGSRQEASRLHPAAPRSQHGAPRSQHGASRSQHEASRSQHGASRSNPPVPMHTDYDEPSDYSVHSPECDGLPPSSPPPPSSPYSTAIPQGLNPIGQYQYNRLRQDIHRSMASEPASRKRTRDNYETMREAEDIETGIVDERYRSRIHDRASMDMRSTLGHNRPKPYVRAPSKARVGPAPNQRTTRLPSRSSAVPYSEGSPSPHQYDSRVQPAHVRPVDRRFLTPVDEYELEYN